MKIHTFSCISNMLSALPMYITLFLIISLCGCASKRKLIESYKPEILPKQDETLIYVFRKREMVGAAHNVTVGCNDKYISTLSAGSYARFFANSELITLNMSYKPLFMFPIGGISTVVYSSQDQIPFLFHQLDNRIGETIYLLYQYGATSLKELDEKKAIPLIIKYKLKENFHDTAFNPTYQTAFFNPGILDSTIMKFSDSSEIPIDGFATVTFVRNTNIGGTFPFGVWSTQRFLGSLKGKRYFQVQLPPGKHTFYTHYLNRRIIKANIKAGYEYFIKVKMSMGWDRGVLKFEPIQNKYSEEGRKIFLAGCRRISLDKDKMVKTTQKRLDLGLQYINEQPDPKQNIEVRWKSLKPEDGKKIIDQ